MSFLIHLKSLQHPFLVKTKDDTQSASDCWEVVQQLEGHTSERNYTIIYQYYKRGTFLL